MRTPIDKNKYIITFLITAIIFGVMLYVNGLLEAARTVDVKSVQDQISLDLLSSETQFDLLKDASCQNMASSSVLSGELNSLSTKLSYLEANSADGAPSPELTYLKRYYSLLEIKDFILMKQLNQKCASKPISVLYFYGNKTDCTECEKMGYVLTYLRQQYPELRIYSFDTNLDISAVDTLKSIYKIQPTELPAVVYDDKTFVGYKSIDEMKAIIPDLKAIDAANLKAAAEAANASSAPGTSTPVTEGQ